MAKLYFSYGCMDAGKTALLLQSAHNFRQKGKRVLILVPDCDTRSEGGVLRSRIGISAPCILFSRVTNLRDLVVYSKDGYPDCVFVDEGQFLTRDQVDQLSSIVDRFDIPVMVYGLRNTFKGFIFDGTEHLFALADEIREIVTICHCGRKATMHLRLDERGEVVNDGEVKQIGFNYASVCRVHFVARQPR